MAEKQRLSLVLYLLWKKSERIVNLPVFLDKSKKKNPQISEKCPIKIFETDVHQVCYIQNGFLYVIYIKTFCNTYILDVRDDLSNSIMNRKVSTLPSLVAMSVVEVELKIFQTVM